MARTAEDLTERSCVFEVDGDEHLRCLRTATSREIDELFAQAKLINQWSELPTGQLMLRILAEQYAEHDQYQPEWRVIEDMQTLPRLPDGRQPGGTGRVGLTHL